jgi:hypothetical protein
MGKATRQCVKKRQKRRKWMLFNFVTTQSVTPCRPNRGAEDSFSPTPLPDCLWSSSVCLCLCLSASILQQFPPSLPGSTGRADSWGSASRLSDPAKISASATHNAPHLFQQHLETRAPRSTPLPSAFLLPHSESLAKTMPRRGSRKYYGLRKCPAGLSGGSGPVARCVRTLPHGPRGRERQAGSR